MKKIVVLTVAALALASCNDNKTPAQSGLAGTVVEGTVNANYALQTSAWTGGAGTIALETSSGTALATTSLNANGTFNFSTLPTPATSELTALDTTTPTGCTGHLSSNDSAALGTTAGLYVTATKSGAVSPMTLAVSGAGTAAQRVVLTTTTLAYTSKAVNVTGTISCPDSSPPMTLTADVKYAQGWTAVKMTMDITGSAVTLTMSNGDFNSGQFVYMATPLATLSKGLSSQLSELSHFSAFR